MSKEVLCTRSLLIGSTWRFRSCSNQEVIRGRRFKACANALRAFFRFAEARGWCRKGLAASIRSPRVFSQASLPLGPSWDDVRRLLAMTEGDQPYNIRARPILMLFAIYGLRRGEVSRLRLEDFDWEHEVFRVVSSKTGRVRTYPLTRSVGDAILRYLQEVRPRSSHRELFLITASSLPAGAARRCGKWLANACDPYTCRFRTTGLMPYVMPVRRDCWPPACLSRRSATNWGTSDPDSTRIYAKVDLVGLRQVADFDMGGVL